MPICTCNTPVLGASASIMGRSSNLRPFALPRPDALSPPPLRSLRRAHNTHWRSPLLFGISWPYRGGAKPYSPNVGEGEFCEVGLPLYGVLGSSLGLGKRRDAGRERNIENKFWYGMYGYATGDYPPTPHDALRKQAASLPGDRENFSGVLPQRKREHHVYRGTLDRVEGTRSTTRRCAARRAWKTAPRGGARGNDCGQEAPGVGLGAQPLLLDHDGGLEGGP